MAAKRSPILGYNHNVRYRGIVFHVQTEDSGIINPHVFTHLFHGGVILSTRKLVYDPDATEDVVKSLMQAQHKAVMKDLKNAVFDDKIDQYLGGTEGLLPRGAPGAVADETRPVPRIDDPTPPAAPPPQPPVAAGAPLPRPERADTWNESSEPVIELVEGGATTPVPVVLDELPMTGMPGGIDAPMTRAPTERVGPAAAFSLEPELAPAPGHPPVAPKLSRNDISEAMNAIQVGDDELAAAGLVEVADADVGQVHSPAPPSTPAPPGVQPERPGQYSVRRGSGPIDPIPGPLPGGPGASHGPGANHGASHGAGHALPTGPGANRPPIPRPTPPSSKLPSVPRAPTPPPVRPVGPGSRPTPTGSKLSAAAVGAADAHAVARPAAGGLAAASGPDHPRAWAPSPRRRARPAQRRVVVSRPPVIVGGPARTVGTPAGQGKVRRAKDTDAGIGGDLISERSLDEVILAYLSEDTSDE
ncbi:MAG: hypothetical protein HS111_17880 [Kofleriaceae bacterium]|nr:hypothetical protein [Kofleriaceae bacterium]